MRQVQILETFSSKKLNKNKILEKLETHKKIEKIIYLNSTY